MKHNKTINKLENLSDTVLSFNRIKVISLYILLVMIFGVIGFNIFKIQILEGGDYLAAATQNYKTTNKIRAPRGLINDSNGVQLAYNKQIYSVYLDPIEFDFEKDGKTTSNLLNIDKDDIEYKIINENVFGRVTLENDLDHEGYLDIIQKINNIDGLYAVAETGRAYINPYLYTHIIGYMGDASEEDINEKVDGTSRVGKTGIEKEMDEYIRGVDGYQITELDITDGERDRYESSKPTPGDNIYLNINHEWQLAGYKAMERKINDVNGVGGSLIVMNTNTGEIKTMVSYPTFNLNEFSDGILNSEYNRVLNNPSKPLLDRATQVALPTGSIFKVITGAVGLEEDVIEDDTIFKSTGCITLPGDIEYCESLNRVLGDLDLYRATKLSSNIYFCEVGKRLTEERDGIETLIKYTEQFGIGKFPGSILSQEANGGMATPERKRAVYGEPWYIGDTCNTVIGQGLVTATPLQMVMIAASFENGGYILKPQVIDRIEDRTGKIIKNFDKEIINEVQIENENMSIINEAMVGAVRDQDGTIRVLDFYPDYISAKTGTADGPETINGKRYTAPHGWVMGTFEYEGEKYSYVANIAHGGWGSSTAEAVKWFLEDILQ
jgi:penicillin-binding protein 2